jgi:hypothetical protein
MRPEYKTVLAQEASKQALAEAKELKRGVCSWCFPGAGDANTSHGMCEMHAQKMIDEILADREKKAAIDALPMPTQAATKACGRCNSCKQNSPFGCIHTARANDWQAVTGY